MKTHIYPENLKAQPVLLFWRLRDLFVIGIMLFISALIFSASGFGVPGAVSFAYAVLCIRSGDTSIKDFLGYAVSYFITSQQEFRWGKDFSNK